MPLLSSEDFQPNFVFKNQHLSTILPSLYRKRKISFNRVRVETPDDDFLDLDFSTVGADKIVVCTHGLEGSSDSSYIKGICKAMNEEGFDAVAINLRGCSGTTNRLFSSYHSGKTDDLDFVVQHLIKQYNYDKIYLVGFSLGGNITLKYVGEMGEQLDSKVLAAVAISTPCHLEDCAYEISKPKNKIYVNNFFKSLKSKLIIKHQKFPDADLDMEAVRKAKTFHEYDSLYTGPAHGYKDASDYYTKCSSLQFLPNIKIPTLIINAQNDSFLADTCYPYKVAKRHKLLHLMTPEFGGHVGFVHNFHFDKVIWNEKKVLAFFRQNS